MRKKLICVTAFVFIAFQLFACGEITPGPSYSLTLNWTTPTTNVDGSNLGDLSGYTVYYGTESRTYSRTIYVPWYANNVKVTDLGPGIWYLSVTAYDYYGNESVFSNEVTYSFY